MIAKQWEIWWAYVKFEDSEKVKKRPVLVVDERKQFCICLKMTSRNRGDSGQEYALKEWKTSGLPKETYVRLGQYFQLMEADFDSKIGDLSERDRLLIQFRTAK